MKYLAPIFASLLLLVSCSSVYIKGSWQAAGKVPARMKKIIVIGLVNDNEIQVRERMEKHLVNDLVARGYQAFCSCEQYGPGSFKGLTEEQVIAKLKNSGADGILTIVLLDAEKEKKYIAARELELPVFWNYYQSVIERLYTKGYYSVGTNYYWETNLYDISDNSILYSVKSNSFGPASTESLAHDYGKRIVRDMIRKGILE